MSSISCTTGNQSQAGAAVRVAQLANDAFGPNRHSRDMGKRPRNPLTNPQGLVKAPQSEVAEIYTRRTPRRPHYLADWMDRRGKTRRDLIEELGADKTQLSRWLDDEKPTTPGPDWAAKLGRYFAAEGDDPIDIFTHPDNDWMTRFFDGRRLEEIERIKLTMETAFPRPARKS